MGTHSMTLACAKRRQVASSHLAIDQAEVVATQMLDQMGEGDLRGVGGAGKHRLAEENLTDHDAV